MYVARGSLDGERCEVERTIKRRLRDAEVLAERDILILEWSLRGWTQDRIGRLLSIRQPVVCVRLKSVPRPITEAMHPLVRRHPDGIPDSSRERFRKALLEYRETVRANRSRPQHALDRRPGLPQSVA